MSLLLDSLVKIGAGLPAVQAKKKPDLKDKLEADDAIKQQSIFLAELIADIQSNRLLRKEYANKVYRYLISYSLFCALIILLQGWKIKEFNLETAPLTVLIGSTAVAAIGLVGFVVQGLFKAPASPDASKKEAEKKSDDA